jgi:ubiquitin carboxyl-terminal hydrolase 4/11/15
VLNPIDFIKTFFRNNKSLNLRGQQDAQEFLSILLDSLHEDLNRITSKPYIELEEQTENENDFEASARWWDCYKKREDSIIIDLFHGQFKSKITCLDCKKTSITYDPFIFLGLPIPNKKEQTIIKFFFGDKLEFLGIDINEKTTIKDLIKKGIELMRMNNYKDELSDDDLYGIIEIVQIDKYKIVRKICNANNKIHQFDPLSILLKNEENLEIVLYEKNIDEKYFNIYVYPIKGEEYDNSSYPMALSVRPEMTFNKIVEENEDKIRSMYTNLHKNDIIIFGLVHRINDNWLYYFTNGFDSKEECPFCKSNGNFCIIHDNYKISQLLQIIKNKKPDYGEALFTIGNKKKNVINKIIKTDKYFNNGVFFLSDCLKLFCEEEMLNQDNLWYCNKCKKHKIAKKQIRLYKLPMYLIIQLKKFKNSSGFFSTSNEKKEAYIKYHINNLDLSEYIGEKGGNKEKYDLYAVIQHHGQISQGHYTAICKINDIWVLFNDSLLSKINNPVTNDAYLLFYRRSENNF